MLFDTITWRDETLHVCISEFENPRHLDSEALIRLAGNQSERVLAVQFFDSSMIVDELHLLCATQNAYNAMRGGYMKSRSIDVEIVLYASAQNQIGVALDLMGITDATRTLDVIVLGNTKQKVEQSVREISSIIGPEVEQAFTMTKQKLKSLMNTFKISGSELELFIEQDDIIAYQRALSKCVASRISQVALTS
jgi:tRNA threonylcarbamoyladenosine modification (KEOPS) complex Cgi121 subunit